MYLLAVSAVEKAQSLPPSMWLKIALGLAIALVAILIARRAARTNKVVLGVALFVVTTILFFSWVYNRNEPRFLTPVVEKIAPFFPSASSYKVKQRTGN